MAGLPPSECGLDDAENWRDGVAAISTQLENSELTSSSGAAVPLRVTSAVIFCPTATGAGMSSRSWPPVGPGERVAISTWPSPPFGAGSQASLRKISSVLPPAAGGRVPRTTIDVAVRETVVIVTGVWVVVAPLRSMPLPPLPKMRFPAASTVAPPVPSMPAPVFALISLPVTIVPVAPVRSVMPSPLVA